MINFNVAPVSTSPRSTIDLGQNNYSNDKYPPASDFRICTKLRTFAVPVLRCSGILPFRCSGVPVLRCSAVPGFTIASCFSDFLCFLSVYFRFPSI